MNTLKNADTKINITVKDLNGLQDAAKEILPLLDNGGVVALHGEMGAGKTTLVSALMRAMESEDEVSSPTFALINDYGIPDGRHVYHFDFYRIDDIREAFDLGYEEYFHGGGLCLVEWPEKVESLIPEDALHITLTVEGDGSRTISVE